MPRSLIGTSPIYQKSVQIEDIISPKFAEAYNSIPPEWFAFDEAQLVSFCKPSPADFGMRANFSKLYTDFCNPSHPHFKRTNIDCKDIYEGISSKKTWNDRVVSNPKRVLFITTPLKSVQVVSELACLIANNRLMEIITLPIKDDKGNVDSKAASVVLQGIREAYNRFQGLPIQRTQNLNVNIDSSKAKEIKEQEATLSLDEQINKLEREIRGAPASIDVEAEDAE